MTGSKNLRYTVFVPDDGGEPKSFGPGDVVPDWARDKITNPEAWADDDQVVEDPAEEESDESYLSMKKAELEAEVERRNAGRDEEDQIVVEAPGNKADLAAALDADDAAYA